MEIGIVLRITNTNQRRNGFALSTFFEPHPDSRSRKILYVVWNFLSLSPVFHHPSSSNFFVLNLLAPIEMDKTFYFDEVGYYCN
jgi:hypothetical protein